jgi:hypothetical protein
MTPTSVALASTLFFNPLWLWQIHQCVPSLKPGPILSLLPGITGFQERSTTTFSSQLSMSSLPHSHLAHLTWLHTRFPNPIQNT